MLLGVARVVPSLMQKVSRKEGRRADSPPFLKVNVQGSQSELVESLGVESGLCSCVGCVTIDRLDQHEMVFNFILNSICFFLKKLLLLGGVF